MFFGGRHKTDQVMVYRATGLTDAYLLRDWFEANDLPCRVQGESLLSLRGQIPIGEAYPSVWVHQRDQSKAETLLKEFEGPTLVHPDWSCPTCDEVNGPNFMSCWSCGRDR